MTTIDYHQQAIDFLEKTGTKENIKFIGKLFPYWDFKNLHDTYDVTYTRNRKSKTFRFYNSVNATMNNTVVTSYDILSTITKSDPDSFENFCSDYGYDSQLIESQRVYKKVKLEYNKVLLLWSDVMEQLQEIK